MALWLQNQFPLFHKNMSFTLLLGINQTDDIPVESDSDYSGPDSNKWAGGGSW